VYSLKKIDFKMTASYDYKYDILDLIIDENYEYQRSLELEYGVILDFDTQNRPVSLEMLDASKKLNLNKNNLINPNIHMSVIVDKESIKLEVEVFYQIHNQKQTQPFDLNIKNEYNIPSIQTELASA